MRRSRRKTCHILETNPDSKVVSIDKSNERLALLNENLKRLSLRAKVINSHLENFKTRQKFDRVLLDAPCSATGVIRRHPDIKLLRKANDIVKLRIQQDRLFSTPSICLLRAASSCTLLAQS